MTALSDTEIEDLDRWWRAANYLSVGQIYLLDNPLLREPLQADQQVLFGSMVRCHCRG
jgi:xylulose-5-phosphate/fructose-6-phosphate phosphoketolase